MSTTNDDPVRANLANWEARVPLHAASHDYGLTRYLDDPAHLSGVVRADAAHLGDLAGLRVAHVQCHIGTDTLSLARLGADEVVGIDFSPTALETARAFTDAAVGGDRLRFVEADVAEIPELGLGPFDLVYTTVGVLCWLPSVATWARIVAGLLRPGGRLYLRDGHPVLEALDDERTDHELVLRYPYFETGDPLRWEEATTYTDASGPVNAPIQYTWNHGIAETVQAVLDAGLTLTALREGRTLDWKALPFMTPEPGGTGRFVLPDGLAERMPLEFALEAVARYGDDLPGSVNRTS